MSVLDDVLPPDRADAAPVTGPLRELLAALTVPGGEKPRISIELDEDGWRALEAQFRRPFRPHSSYKLLPLETGVVAFQRKREPEVAEVCGARPALDSGDAWACPASVGHGGPHVDYAGKPWPQLSRVAQVADHEMEWTASNGDLAEVAPLCTRHGCGRPPNAHPRPQETTGWVPPPVPGAPATAQTSCGVSVSDGPAPGTLVGPGHETVEYTGAWRERK